MEVRKLTCPSCGAAVDIPAGLDRAHCVYCGSDIIIEDTETRRRASDLANYLELGETALEGGDTEEAEQWFNKALELDVKNEQAWVGKAVVSGFEESLRCLEKALEINPDSQAAGRALRRLATAEWKLACMTYLAYEKLSEARGEFLGVHGKAKQLAAPRVANAIKYAERALALDPNDGPMLSLIIGCLVGTLGGPEFGNPAPYKQRLRLLELREKAPTELPALRQKLTGVRKELAQAEERGGLFSGLRIKRLRDQEQSLMKSIDVYEEALSKQRA